MFKGYEQAHNFTRDRPVVAGQPRIAPTVLLGLPMIEKGVPQAYKQAAHPSIALLVRQLANIGVIRTDDIRKQFDLGETVRQVVGREISNALGELKHVELSVAISDGTDDEYSNVHRECTASENERIHFSMCLLGQPVLHIGTRLGGLEQLRPGLGQTVYSVLQQAAWGSFGLFTPDLVLDGIPWLYHLDEREDAERAGADDAEMAEMFEGMPTRKELLEGIPFEWVTNPKIRLTPRSVRRIAGDSSTPRWAKDVLGATLDVASAVPSGRRKLGVMDYEDVQSVYSLAVLRFSDDDKVDQMFDDYINMCNNCSDSYTDTAHMETVDLRTTVHFKQWWDGIIAGCQLVHSLDKLLSTLSCSST